jgi:hypothetical protein
LLHLECAFADRHAFIARGLLLFCKILVPVGLGAITNRAGASKDYRPFASLYTIADGDAKKFLLANTLILTHKNCEPDDAAC